MEEFTEQELIDNIPRIISMCFLYGEFTLEFRQQKRQTVFINSSPFDSGGLIDKVREAAAKIENDKNEDQKLFRKDIETIQFLIKEGFAIHRHDITQLGKKFVQLTDRGRELKEIGSLHAFNELQDKKRQAIKNEQIYRNQERQRNEELYGIAKMQHRISENQYLTNILLCIWTGFAAIYSLIQIFEWAIKNYLFFLVNLLF